MLELSRTVRMCIGAQASPGSRRNGFVAWPPPQGLARYVELEVTCHGTADPQTGYFINIKHIDRAVHANALPILDDACRGEADRRSPAPMGALMQSLLSVLQPALDDTVAEIALSLTPRTALIHRQASPSMVTIRQQYEFSAAHRLHAEGLSDAENREVFGKCNNPAGHGHNYVVEVAAGVPIAEDGQALSIAELDEAIDGRVIEKLDHKHLNVDVPEFAERNPSVEHIAQVIWGWLDGGLPGGARLEAVSVWETGKTVCTYRGPAANPSPGESIVAGARTA